MKNLLDQWLPFYILKQGGKNLTKEIILNRLVQYSGRGSHVNNLRELSLVRQRTEIPIVLFSYRIKEQDSVLTFIKKLQVIFEQQEYACAVLCDFIENTNFEDGWYVVDHQNPKKSISYYRSILSVSVIILVIKDRKVAEIPYDYLVEKVDESMTITDSGLYMVFNEIVEALS